VRKEFSGVHESLKASKYMVVVSSQVCPLRMILRSVLWLLIILTCSGSVASAQSDALEKQVVAALRGKILTLKTFRKNGRVELDGAGQIKNKGETGPWTIYSRFVVTKIELSDSRLRVGGPRIIHYRDPVQKQIVGARSDMNIDVDIDITQGASAADISAAIARTFAGAEGLAPYVPEYWRPYVEGKSESLTCAPATTTVRIGGNVAAANLLTQVRPRYPEEAKRFLVQGVVVLQALITETGDVGRLLIIEPVGAGLDENAVEAVSQWKYKPTLLNGAPVCVVTTITVNYAFSR
jgi:TonB family protein